MGTGSFDRTVFQGSSEFQASGSYFLSQMGSPDGSQGIVVRSVLSSGLVLFVVSEYADNFFDGNCLGKAGVGTLCFVGEGAFYSFFTQSGASSKFVFFVVSAFHVNWESVFTTIPRSESCPESDKLHWLDVLLA